MKTLPMSYNPSIPTPWGNIIGVHVLTKTVDGNHLPFTTRKTITVFDEDFTRTEISQEEYDSHIKGSGIRKLTGYLETGGGRHQFFGLDVNEAEEALYL
jgi:hypothetical protein